MAQYSHLPPWPDQILPHSTKEEKRFLTEWPRSIVKDVDNQQNGRKKSTLRTSGTHKLPLGYTHTRWVSELSFFRTDQRKIITFSNREVFKLYTVKEIDTVTIDEVVMTSDFSNGDILDLMLTGQPTFFLRPVADQFAEKFLEWTTREKIDGNFVTVRSLKERNPFFSHSMVSKGFYSIRVCNSNGLYEQVSTGRQENNQWLVESIIVQKDCQTNALISEWKWTYTLNADIQRVEEKYYTKENDTYRLDSHSKWEYNEQKQEKAIFSVLENTKQEFEYDEFNGISASRYTWNGTEWVQNARTIREVTPGPDKTIVLYTYQTLVNDNWKILYNETRHLDSKNRQIFYSSEHYNRDTQQLTNSYYFKNKFYKDLLIEESEYFNMNSKGQKAIYAYDDKDRVVQIETQLCANLTECLNGLYQPDRKIEYSEGIIDSLDYQRSFTYTDGNWRKSDSLTNLYDKDGDLIEMYAENFTLDKKERIRFNYKQDLVTGLHEEEPINLTFYPNPTEGAMMIETQLSNYTLSLYDLNGKLLGSYCNPSAIDMVTRLPGMYLMLIEANGKRYRQKVIRR
jgi:hypothetical protein